jgi:hypothetical protein
MADMYGKDTEEIFYLLADRIAAIPDPAERAAMAFDLLGKSGKGMGALLGQGADNLRQMVDSVNKLDMEKVAMLAHTKDMLDDAQNTLTIWVGKTLGTWGEFWSDIGKATSGSYFAGMEEEARKLVDAKKAAEERARVESEIADAMKAQEIQADARKETEKHHKEMLKEEIAMRKRSAAELKEIREHEKDANNKLEASLKRQKAILEDISAGFLGKSKAKEISLGTQGIASEYTETIRRLSEAESAGDYYKNDFTRSNIAALRAEKQRLLGELNRSIGADLKDSSRDVFKENTASIVANIISKIAPVGVVKVSVQEE